jgi:hypothetical protein
MWLELVREVPESLSTVLHSRAKERSISRDDSIPGCRINHHYTPPT